MVDDRLCVKKENFEIVYATGETLNELWVPLIEKAYAKIHQCYQALISGDIGQGLMDLTGMIATKQSFDFRKMPEKLAIEAKAGLWKALLQAKKS